MAMTVKFIMTRPAGDNQDWYYNTQEPENRSALDKIQGFYRNLNMQLVDNISLDGRMFTRTLTMPDQATWQLFIALITNLIPGHVDIRTRWFNKTGHSLTIEMYDQKNSLFHSKKIH